MNISVGFVVSEAVLKLTGRVEESLTGEFLFKINIRVPFQRLECFSFF